VNPTTLAIYLSSGQILRIKVVDWTWSRGVNGRKFEWETPKGEARIAHLDVNEITAIVEETR
jgi:hypothetical protein